MSGKEYITFTDDYLTIKKPGKQSVLDIDFNTGAVRLRGNLIAGGQTIPPAELGLLAGLSADALEIDTLDGVTAGTVTASKAVVVGASRDVDYLVVTALGSTTATLTSIILGKRLSTSTAAGATISLDASTDTYAEGLELRYAMADWADGAVTHTDAKGMYLRMENTEANSNGSVYGCEVYGVSNNVANTKNVWGGLFYAYVKGTTAATITGLYALQPELSFDAGASAHTITEAACVRAKVTGGAMSSYTALHGYKLIAGDMDGGSRTYGNAIWVVDDGDMSGTCGWTKGLYLQATCTTAIDIDSCTTGVDIACTGAAITAVSSAIGATGRAAKFAATMANGALTDGYGAVEIDVTATGTMTDTCAASSTWLNFAASSSGGSNLVCVQNNGIYVSATGTPMASATAIIGMRMQYVADGGGNPGALYLFSTNIFDNVLTAMFHVNAAVDIGWASGTKSGGTAGNFPIFRDVSAGVTHYVNTYTA